MERKRFRKGIYVLPNLFTSLNLFFGFYAIILCIEGNFVLAASLIIIAGLCDGLDGKVARATSTTSRFGVEFDSLADLVSFGVAPGIMYYLWGLTAMGRIGWLAGFLFATCGALRLARFNTQTESVSSNYFIGLPIPAAACMLAVTILFFDRVGISPDAHPVLFLLPVYVLSFLMVSTVRYNSFKHPGLFRRMNLNVLVGAILVFIFIAAQPPIALFMIGVLYVVSGPLMTLRHRKTPQPVGQNTANGSKEHPKVL